jgi:hypothetical protein
LAAVAALPAASSFRRVAPTALPRANTSAPISLSTPRTGQQGKIGSLGKENGFTPYVCQLDRPIGTKIGHWAITF